MADLAAQLGRISGLADAEQVAILDATRFSLDLAVHRRVSRTLILELNAARVTGRLDGADASQRWDRFTEISSTRRYWTDLSDHYPTMLARLDTLIANRVAAAARFAARFALDRDDLAALTGSKPAPLTEVVLGAGDSHRGGETVALVTCGGGQLVYKPRSLGVDRALTGFLDDVLSGWGPASPGSGGRIEVPTVIDRGSYGWAEHIEHRYCDDAELGGFYRRLGHWLAVMRLLGGVDLHGENVIARGSVPVVVDCEALFTPQPSARPSGLGGATDLAGSLIENTVLRIGLLPGRGLALGFRGVDASAAGGLPDQQPMAERPVIVAGGTDEARIGIEAARIDLPITSHPSPRPVLDRHWPSLVDGFEELTDHLAELDRRGQLVSMLDRFRSCPVRVVCRETEAYAELERMLWHPVALHDPDAAVDQAVEILTDMADRAPLASGSIDVVRAEIAELLDGDVPTFETTPGHGVLDGPRQTTCMPERDLVTDSLERWRAMDRRLERQVISTALVSAYLNDGWVPGGDAMEVTDSPADDLERRRRKLAAEIVGDLVKGALVADDGTATWIAAVFNPTGWAVQPLAEDLYGGVVGVAVLLAGYRHEVAAGRADPVQGVDELLAQVVNTARTAEDALAAERAAEYEVRPPPPGAYIGLGSQIWAWLLLERLGATPVEALERCRALAGVLPASVADDDQGGLLIGRAGAIVPLLALAVRTGDAGLVDQALAIGESLLDASRVDRRGRYWPTRDWPDGLGGVAHGSTGIGWSLARLGHHVADHRFVDAAEEAFQFDEAQYDPLVGGWRDLREGAEAVGTANAWCHGSVGIGLHALDLADHWSRGPSEGQVGVRPLGVSHPPGLRWETDDVIRRACVAALADGVGWNHTLCHGDLGVWELLAKAIPLGLAPEGVDRRTLDARMVAGIEQHGPVSGLNRETVAPGLLPGQGGMAYQLLRLDPRCELPSLLVVCEDLL